VTGMIQNLENRCLGDAVGRLEPEVNKAKAEVQRVSIERDQV
jgi:hypothetical protein